MSHGASTKRAIMYALAANLGIAVAKGVAAFITGSGSMLAETIHSSADSINQMLLFLGIRRSGRAPTADHPLGYGKVVYFWSFIVAILLFSLGGIFSIFEGINKIRAPEQLHDIWIAVAVLCVSIVLELSSLAGALREVNRMRGGRSFLQWLRVTRNSEIVVVLGEDSAAVVGLLLALVFVLLSYLTHEPLYDAAGSIVIGAILMIISILLVIRMKSLLIGKSADPEMIAFIRDFISLDPAIKDVYNVITIQVGPYIMLAAKIRMIPGLKITEACKKINALEKRIKEQYPEVRWSFIEPDIAD